MKKTSPTKRPQTSPAKKTKTVVTEQTYVSTVKFTNSHLTQGENSTLQLLLKEKEIELEDKLNTLVGVQHKLNVFDDMKKEVGENKALLREVTEVREELQVKFGITAEKVREDTDLKKQFQDNLLLEISQLKEDIQERARKAAQKEQEHIDELARQKTQHTDQLNATKKECSETVNATKKECSETVDKLTKTHSDQLNATKKECSETVNATKKECSETVSRLTHQHTEEMQTLKLTHSREMETQRNHYETKIDDLESNLRRCQQTIISLEATVLELRTTLEKKVDVEKERDMWRRHHDSMEIAKEELQAQLLGASEYIVELEAKYYESQTTQLEMLKQLKAYEAEIDTLRQYIIDLKSRIAVYIPVKGDQIDKKLAEYINNYPDRQKLKIMFMRESEGIYQFGTKRVSVKCVKDKIQIIVGGGFLSLDEFLDQYTPAELEKLERKDPMRRMGDRIALQKTLQGHAIREDRSPSPKKI